MSNEFANDDMVTDNGDVDDLVEQGLELISAILEGQSFQTIESRIKAGAPLWAQDSDGMSALHAAALRQDQEMVQFLIAEGAVWNAGR